MVTPSSSTAAEHQAETSHELHSGDVILFQGDSITDVRRNRKAEGNPNNADTLGNGYPCLIGASLLADHRKHALKVLNRGISGNKVPDLDKRWQKDCLDLKPAVLSILIGVNDIWHKINGKYDGTVETYQTGFADLLEKTRLGTARNKDRHLRTVRPAVRGCERFLVPGVRPAARCRQERRRRGRRDMGSFSINV